MRRHGEKPGGPVTFPGFPGHRGKRLTAADIYGGNLSGDSNRNGR
nr:MAG TPA: hypothetical protein [Caudoviricetes sp.]